MPTIDLNIFANFSSPEIDDLPLRDTIESLDAAFGLGSFTAIRIFCHPAPFSVSWSNFQRFASSIMGKHRCAIERTRGLAQGYLQSLALSSSNYSLQLEHDWAWNPEHISHDLQELCSIMQTGSLPHLRFNKRRNENFVATPQKWMFSENLTELSVDGVRICQTTAFSNNPHLVSIAAARNHYASWIKPSRGRSAGIEEELSIRYRTGWIYGPLGHPPTITHLDGSAPTRTYAGQSSMHKLWLSTMRRSRDLIAVSRYQRRYN